MKLVFLDIDGVLVTYKSWGSPRAYNHANADGDCVQALNWLTETTGARIVVSSQWRKMGSIQHLRQILNVHFGVNGRVIGVTPEIRKYKTIRSGMRPIRLELTVERGREIDRWLTHYREEPVTAYVILDDDDDMGEHRHRLVQTEFAHGLTMEHARRAAALLNESRNR